MPGMPCVDLKSFELFVDPTCDTMVGPEEQAKFFSEMPPGFGIQGCSPIEMPGAPEGPDGKPFQLFIQNLCRETEIEFGAFMDDKCSMPMEGVPSYKIPLEDGRANCWTPDGKIYLNA